MKSHRYFYAALVWWALEILCLQAQELPYTLSPGSRCHDPEEEYYEESIQKCCRMCPPGFRVREKCGQDANTQCVRCADGLFNTNWSRTGRCFSCSPQCREGFVEEKTCTSTQNRICWCPAGHFCSYLVSDKCYLCQPYRKCPMGYGVLRAGTRKTDVECGPCQEGTFSDHESHQNLCTPHRICQSVLVPGNSTRDAVCGKPGGQVEPRTTSPQLTTATKRLLWRIGTERPTFNQQDVSAQTGRIVGMTAIPVVLAALICFIVFRKSGQKCIPIWEVKKQQFLPAEKFPVKWPQEPAAVGQEKDSLLRTSPSSLWDSPAGSEKKSEASNGDPPKMETNDMQQRPLNDSICYSTGDSRIGGDGKTHVNVSCVVSICNGGHSPALKPSWAAEDPPLSQEETTVRKESGRPVAEEVEDSLDFLEPLPLSVQDAGMKSS